MSSSLRDQLLQAGLVTKKSTQKPKQKQKKKKASPASDLAKFYQQRATQERTEKQEIDRKKQLATQLKKEKRRKIRQLINKHKLDNTLADIRYNFVVTTTIKYIFVTTEQQEQLEQGKLAITFQAGQSYLLPNEIGKEILQITPSKIVIFQE